MPPQPKKVAVLGGGMGSLAAAWHLARTGGYEITVYQRDHLLGGKGSSVRSSDPGFGQRIEEHGIHILMGWYEDAVRVLREVYQNLEQHPLPEELGRPMPWNEVLLPHDSASMAESPQLTERSWDFWTVELPQRSGYPGDGRRPSGIVKLIVILIRWLSRLRGHTFSDFAHIPAAPRILQTFGYDTGLSDQEYAKQDDDVTDEEAEKLLASFQQMDGAAQLRADAEALSAAVFSLGALKSEDKNRRVRRVFMAYWFASAMATGLLAERVTSRKDFEKFDDQEFSQWLRKHGGYEKASRYMTWDSPIVRILYDLSFGHGCEFAAGVWAWAVLLFAFAYKGSYVYKMNGGMGDVVFAPLYLALQKHDVRFRFLHEVERIETDGQQVTEIRIADRGGLQEDYNALVGVDRDHHGLLPSWPDAPNAQLSAGPPVTLKLGQDFDHVILGIGVGGLDPICEPLKANPDFRRMLEHSATVGTQAAQFWLNRDCRSLGWTADELVACYVRPFNSCVQMNHVLRSEDWPDGQWPRSCVYLCDQVADDATHDQVKASLLEFLRSGGNELMPRFTFDDLYDPLNRQGEERLEAQYWRANVTGSDRYVITPPNSPQHRLAPHESGFANLFLAGDWVKTDINAGCLEAATRGGLAAAKALISKG